MNLITRPGGTLPSAIVGRGRSTATPTWSAAHRGRPNNGAFRATHLLVREDDAWRLAAIHLSLIAAARAGTAGK
jgi:hypothetical protein